MANVVGKSVQFPETELGQRSALAMRVLLVQISVSVQQIKSPLFPEPVQLSLLAHWKRFLNGDIYGFRIFISGYTYVTISGILCGCCCYEEGSEFHISDFNFKMVTLSDVGKILYRSGLRKLSQFFVLEAVFAMEIMSDSLKSVNRRIFNFWNYGYNFVKYI